MESATARVRITIVALIEIGVSLTPANPATPMPTIVDSAITSNVENVAVSERTMSQVIANMAKNITGISEAASCRPTSENALFSMDTPVNDISMPPNSASIRSRSSRAAPTASGTSMRLFSGYCSTTLTAVTAADSVMS